MHYYTFKPKDYMSKTAFLEPMEDLAYRRMLDHCYLTEKPLPENMSDYCRTSAKDAFKHLIENANSKYIVVSYNNTYNSKSSSSENKITYEQLFSILSAKGKTKVFESKYKAFNTGKTDFADHKELLFITKNDD